MKIKKEQTKLRNKIRLKIIKSRLISPNKMMNKNKQRNNPKKLIKPLLMQKLN